MNASDRSNLFLPLSGLLLVLASFGGLILFEKPLKSLRPQTGKTKTAGSFQDEDLPARLWQDPFEPVHEEDQSNEGQEVKESRRLESLAARILETSRTSQEADEPASPHLILLPVLLPGGNYAEDGESRRRIRQAVVSALSIKGYSPESGDKIGFIKTRWRRNARLLTGVDFEKSNPSGVVELNISFEWFSHDPLNDELGKSDGPETDVDRDGGGANPSGQVQNSKPVLVLWLNEDVFAGYVLPKLNELLSKLLPQDSSYESFSPTADNLSVRQIRIEAQTQASQYASENAVENPTSETTRSNLDHVDVRLLGPSSSSLMLDFLDPLSWEQLGRSNASEQDLDSAASKKAMDALIEMVREHKAKEGNNNKKSYSATIKTDSAMNLSKQFHQFVMARLPDSTKTQKNISISLSASQSLFAEDFFWFSQCPIEGSPGDFDNTIDRMQLELRRRLAFDLRSVNLPEKGWVNKTISAWADWVVSASPAPNLLRDRLVIYSGRATADRDELVKYLPSVADVESKSIAGIIQEKYGIEFHSTIVDDQKLVKAILNELKYRRIRLGSGRRKHIVLISEWDTLYGRALPRTFKRAVSEHDRVHRFSYMRGIDGAIPGQSRKIPETSASKAELSSGIESFTFEQFEQPVGNSGLDHMRRLSIELSQLELILNRNHQQIDAIGVIGSDVYDKLLVLQSLRMRFPDATFFTTDLDARLLHPSQFDWCRNLIVASGFNLELDRGIQRHIPPFRDGYQTSVFLGGLLALGGVEYQDDDLNIKSIEQDSILKALKPLVFEIGRQWAYDISNKEAAGKLNVKDGGDAGFLHPRDREVPLRFLDVVCIITLAALVTLMATSVSPSLYRLFMVDKKDGKAQKRNWWMLFCVVLFSLVGFLVFWGLAVWDSSRDGGEPFELAGGISIWPSEFLRWLMIVISLAYVATAINRIKLSNQELVNELLTPESLQDGEMDAAGPEDSSTGKRARPPSNNRRTVGVSWMLQFFVRLLHSANLWRKRFNKISIAEWDRELSRNKCQKTCGLGLFSKYQKLGKIKCRFFRIIPLVLMCLGFGLILPSVFESASAPVRGEFAFQVDRWMLWGVCGGLVLLTFFVVDATRLCDVFTRSLANSPTVWPKTHFLKKVQRERGIDDFEDLAELIDVRVIAKRTVAIGGLITMPFVVLFVAFVSINGYFDRWRLSMVEYAFFGTILIYAIMSALLLRWSSEQARAKALDRMKVKLSQARNPRTQSGVNRGELSNGTETSPTMTERNQARAEQLQLLINEIESLSKGAFSSWSQHPVVRAVLIPFGGIGTVYLLEFLSRLGI